MIRFQDLDPFRRGRRIDISRIFPFDRERSECRTEPDGVIFSLREDWWGFTLFCGCFETSLEGIEYVFDAQDGFGILDLP